MTFAHFARALQAVFLDTFALERAMTRKHPFLGS